MTNQQNITVNGKPKSTPTDCSISNLLLQLKISNPAIAIELNGEIVSASDFESQKVVDGDAVEIVSFVGGG